ncbi:bifunctional UDP-N-acetylglucosamine diphosphorylase/glucosamine-1-phosphate N-acetyltransferase GlmU [Marinicrinis lubricantis]|uniref:Bifunctional protein GlmU n=1 Tax=Marinicrinis lubricantis TaxID=2086470 RepID=A0ABW1IQG4_9BACL
MKKRIGIVLAAGQGKRMKSKLYKVLHPVCGVPMVGHVIKLLNDINADRTVVIVGHGAEAVQQCLDGQAEFVLQQEQLGTGHAVLQAKELLSEEEGTTFVVCGDTPLIRHESLQQMMDLHERTGAAATIMTAELEKPHGYGRIVRDTDGSVKSIVEQKDCTEEQSSIREINTGTYCFDNQKLFKALAKVTNQNAQQEYYLTDVIGILRASGELVQGYILEDEQESIGINDRVALSEAERLMRRRIAEMHMRNGVTIIDPDSTYIDADVQIGMDTTLLPNTILKGKTQIGEGCLIGPNSELADTIVGDSCSVKQSVIAESKLGSDIQVGPFAYIRPGSEISDQVKIGDFVEIKKSVIGSGSKVPHLSYVGDAIVGSGVNIGCGTITANYDGLRKHTTTIEDGAFIGSNSNLIAPVKIGKNAYVVAGSTITQDVDADGLAIARARQTTKSGYASKLKKRIEQQNKSKS